MNIFRWLKVILFRTDSSQEPLPYVKDFREGPTSISIVLNTSVEDLTVIFLTVLKKCNSYIFPLRSSNSFSYPLPII